jgi:hypothetical protein
MSSAQVWVDGSPIDTRVSFVLTAACEVNPKYTSELFEEQTSLYEKADAIQVPGSIVCTYHKHLRAITQSKFTP